MLPHEDALRLVRDAARGRGLLPAETVALSDALGRTTAEPVSGVDAIPPFDNSSMDGYALASARAAGAPALLPVLGTIMAGDPPRCQAESGAWRIMTGAPIPAGCDAVVPVERTRATPDGRGVEILESPHPGDFVRGRGRDFAEGALVCPEGSVLTARHLLALAAVGRREVSVRRRPRVALISTGRELVTPGAPLEPGQIRDATSSYLAAALPLLGCDFESHGVVADDPAAFERRLDRLRGVDLVLTTGAVSMGDADFIPSSLAKLGAETVFHKAAIRPGKPVLFARFPKGPFVFGLPGNPVSTVVGLRFFAEPLIRELLGRPVEAPSRARLSAAVEKPEHLKCFFKARHVSPGVVEILPGQQSFQIYSLLSSDCWAILPLGKSSLAEGEEIEVMPLLSEPLG